MRLLGILLFGIVVVASAATAEAAIITLSDAEQMAMGFLTGWGGSGTLNSRTDIAGDGVRYNITLGTTGDAKFPYGKWSGNYADWRAYEGFALKFTLESATVDGVVECANFTGTKGWGFRQTKASWPKLSIGESAIVYIDFDDCIDGDGNPQSMSDDDLNKVCGAGWQVITKDPDMLGATITLLVEPSTVPEPASLGLLALGGLAVLLKRKRR